MIGKLERVPLRDVWKHEAYDFTRWLQDNIDVLGEVVDFSLSNAEPEQSAGVFSVDLVAEDESGNPVVIENQLEKSNHDHLGKLITYLTALGAKKAIWLVADPRPEHVGAIAWLNESSSADFYLLKVEAVQIGNSSRAPLLTLIVGPSKESREVGDTKKELAERHIIRKRFWKKLLEKAKEKTKLHANLSPGYSNWCGAGAGKSGLAFNYIANKSEWWTELYIDRGKENAEENMAIFDSLVEQKKAIEQVFGQQLEWQRLESKRACRIRSRVQSGGYRDEDQWQQIQDAMIDSMIRMEKAFKPFISKLKV